MTRVDKGGGGFGQVLGQIWELYAMEKCGFMKEFRMPGVIDYNTL